MGPRTRRTGLHRKESGMSLLTDLHGAALASDERADWQRLWQALAGTRLVVPIEK